jgi:hypothetical protein
MDKIHEAPGTCNLKVFEHHQSKMATTIVGTWHASDLLKKHKGFASMMLKDKDIEEFVY